MSFWLSWKSPFCQLITFLTSFATIEMPVCANCSQQVGESKHLTCDACKRALHLNCTDVSLKDDRVTRMKMRNIRIVCNQCSANIDQFSNLETLLKSFRQDIKEQLDGFAAKFEDINKKLSTIDHLNSVDFTEDIASEAFDRLNRARNIMIKGVPEVAGQKEVKKEHDRKIVADVLGKVGSEATPVAILRVGGVNTNSPYPRGIKVVLSSEQEAKHVFRNSGKLLESRETKDFRITDDKTALQIKYLNSLREQLESRKKNGEADITIKYIRGQPKIVKNFRK